MAHITKTVGADIIRPFLNETALRVTYNPSSVKAFSFATFPSGKAKKEPHQMVRFLNILLETINVWRTEVHDVLF